MARPPLVWEGEEAPYMYGSSRMKMKNLTHKVPPPCCGRNINKGKATFRIHFRKLYQFLYVVFLISLHDIIFQWQSYTRSMIEMYRSNMNFSLNCWTKFSLMLWNGLTLPPLCCGRYNREWASSPGALPNPNMTQHDRQGWRFYSTLPHHSAPWFRGDCQCKRT